MSEEDVEQFLWDVERELAHVDGDERRELMQEAEQRLQEAANRVAAKDDADSLQWYHYVQATAEVGPPERLAAELSGGELPDRSRSHTRLWIGAAVLVIAVAAIFSYAWFTTGDLEPLGDWGGELSGQSARETLVFNVSSEAESVFLSTEIRPTTANATARVTVLDGELNTVYEAQATATQPLSTAEFLEGKPGKWRVIVDFETFTGTWKISAKEELS